MTETGRIALAMLILATVVGVVGISCRLWYPDRWCARSQRALNRSIRRFWLLTVLTTLAAVALVVLITRAIVAVLARTGTP